MQLDAFIVEYACVESMGEFSREKSHFMTRLKLTSYPAYYPEETFLLLEKLQRRPKKTKWRREIETEEIC